MRELFLLPKQFVYEIIALLHLGISFYDGIHVYLKHRGYCLAVGGWPLRQTQTIRIAGLYEIDVILAEGRYPKLGSRPAAPIHPYRC